MGWQIVLLDADDPTTSEPTEPTASEPTASEPTQQMGPNSNDTEPTRPDDSGTVVRKRN